LTQGGKATTIVTTIFNDSADQESKIIILGYLPRFYEEYIRAIRKHRVVIFSGSLASSRISTGIALAIAAFAEKCLAFVKSYDGKNEAISNWGITQKILEITEQQLPEAGDLEEFAEKLRELAMDASRLLDNAWEGVSFGITFIR